MIFFVFCANLLPFDRRNTLQFLYLMVFLSENFFKLNNRSCNYHKLQNIQSIFEKIINIFSVPSNITTCWERIWSTNFWIVSGTVQPNSVLTKFSVFYEIMVLWANITHIKSHAMALVFCLQTYMNQIQFCPSSTLWDLNSLHSNSAV